MTVCNGIKNQTIKNLNKPFFPKIGFQNSEDNIGKFTCDEPVFMSALVKIQFSIEK